MTWQKRNSIRDWSATQRASFLGEAKQTVRSLAVFQTAVDQRARPTCVVIGYAANKRDIGQTSSDLVYKPILLQPAHDLRIYDLFRNRPHRDVGHLRLPVRDFVGVADIGVQEIPSRAQNTLHLGEESGDVL